MSDRSNRQTLRILTISALLLFIANLALFLRINRLEEKVLDSLRPFRQRSGLAPGTKAPRFALLNTDGGTVSLSMLSGRRILLAFTSISCSACRETYPQLKQFSESEPEIATVIISKGSTDENLSLALEQGFEIPILTWTDQVAEAYSVPGTPYFYVIGVDGIIEGGGFAASIAQLNRLASVEELE